MSAAVKRSCTSHRPFQVMILIGVCLAMFCARYSSGIMITEVTPHSRATSSTTVAALEDVQHTSLSALTSAEVFTYVTTGTPGYFCLRMRTSAPVIEAAREH